MTPPAKKAARKQLKLSLPEDLRIQAVVELHREWQTLVDIKEVEGKNVEQVDAAGMQLLLAFANEQAARGIAIKWSGMSEKLTAAIHCLGMHEAFGMERA